MSATLTDGAGALAITWSQSTFDVTWEFDDGLPLTGSWHFIVENPYDASNAAVGTCVIEQAGTPDLTPGIVRTTIDAVTMKNLNGKYRYSLRNVVGSVETVEVAGEFDVRRTAL